MGVAVHGAEPRVSVVIPCYNAAEFLPDTLASAFDQTLREIEVIVVDDGSTDGSAEVARKTTSGNRVPVRVIEIPNSGGPSTPRNVGVDASRADLILCIDADDQLTPRFLELCVAALDAHPDASIAFTDQQDFGASSKHHSVSEYDFLALTRQNIFGNCSVFRKQAWEDAGGFDPGMLYEDWFFWLSCGIRGHFGIKVHGVDWRYRVRDQGLYRTEYLPKDRATKAQIVQRLPGIYGPQEQAWAQLVLSGNPLADQIPDTVGVIPAFAPAPAAQTIEIAPVPSQPELPVPGSTRPAVSVVVAAHNAARHLPRALDSALAQRDLDGPVELIVVDDGSDDDTPEVLARYGERLRAVRQAHAGLASAIGHGLSIVSGEFVALLDANGSWPADHLARHVAALRANPQVGLVHGDVATVNSDGQTVQPSHFAQLEAPPPEGRVIGALLAENFVHGGSATFRACLLPACQPFPPDLVAWEWWLAAALASVAEVRSVAGIATTLSQDEGHEHGPAAREVRHRDLPLRRRLLRDLAADPTVTAADLLRARSALLDAIGTAALNRTGGARGVLDPDPDAAALVLAKLPRLCVGAARSKALTRALAEDPFDGAIWLDLDRTLQLEHRLGPLAPPAPLVELLDVAPVTLAWFDELVASPGLLAAFGAYAAEEGRGELAVVTPHTTDIAALIRVAERNPQISGSEIAVRVISEPLTPPARSLLRSAAGSALTRAAAPAPYGELPIHPAALAATS